MVGAHRDDLVRECDFEPSFPVVLTFPRALVVNTIHWLNVDKSNSEMLHIVLNLLVWGVEVES